METQMEKLCLAVQQQCSNFHDTFLVLLKHTYCTVFLYYFLPNSLFMNTDGNTVDEHLARISAFTSGIKGGGTCCFHAFRVVYTGKEFDSHAKHGQSFKKKFGRITEYFCAKNLTSGFVQVLESFFDRCTLWRKRRWNSLYGHFSRKERVVHASSRVRARERPSTRFNRQAGSTGLAREECL